MESKVLLYDSNNVKIGETFIRRARQLVKQQRASWIDEKQDAIRFAPGMENLDDTMDDDIHEKKLAKSSGEDEELMKLAKQRVHARIGFNLHRSISVIICAFLILIYFITGGGYFWPIWPIFGLGLSVAIHGVVFKIVNGDDMTSKIAFEYEQLKHMESYKPYVEKEAKR